MGGDSSPEVADTTTTPAPTKDQQHQDSGIGQRWPSDIAPDVNCPHCGWVILCKHCPPGDPYPPGCITPRPPRVEGNHDWADYFGTETVGGDTR
jgi:DNA-directed RNA polymerase subunit RPC12/RpoP